MSKRGKVLHYNLSSGRRIALNCATKVARAKGLNKSNINYLDITNILVVLPQICYFEIFDITNPLFSEEIYPVAIDFVKSRFHCSFLVFSRNNSEKTLTVTFENVCGLAYETSNPVKMRYFKSFIAQFISFF